MAIQDPVVTVLLHVELDVCSITTGDLGFCHQERGSNLAVQESTEPLLLLLLGTVFRNDLHVASIGGSTVGSFTSRAALPQILGHQAIFEVAESGTFLEVVLGQEHVPQPKFLRFDFQVFDHLRVCVEAADGAVAKLLLENGICGDTFFLDEALDL